MKKKRIGMFIEDSGGDYYKADFFDRFCVMICYTSTSEKNFYKSFEIRGVKFFKHSNEKNHKQEFTLYYVEEFEFDAGRIQTCDVAMLMKGMIEDIIDGSNINYEYFEDNLKDIVKQRIQEESENVDVD